MFEKCICQTTGAIDGCVLKGKKNASNESIKKKEEVHDDRQHASVWLNYLCFSSSSSIPTVLLFFLLFLLSPGTLCGNCRWRIAVNEGGVVRLRARVCARERSCSIDKHPRVYSLHKSHLLHTCTHARRPHPERLTFSHCHPAVKLQQHEGFTFDIDFPSLANKE